MMQIRHARLLTLAILILGMTTMTAWGQTLPKNRRAVIEPSLVNLKPNAEQAFKIIMIPTRLMAADVPKEVKWAVNDIPGGNDQVGTISPEGVYRAPHKIPSPCEVHICAEVPEAANHYLWATVIVGEGPPRYKQCGYWTESILNDSKKSGHLADPHGLGLDKEGNILIADQKGSKVLRYTVEGKYLNEIGKGSGYEPGQFTEPRIVTSDSEGLIYVTDSKGDRPRIQVFNPDGTFVRIFAEKGMKPGMILRAHGMAFDPAGRLFVVDVDNMRVNLYERDGTHLYDWGKEGLNPGELNSPHGIHVDKNADVFLNSYYGPVQKFNSEGDYLLGLCYPDPPNGPVYFHNMTGDRWGNVYISVRSKGGYQGAVQKDGKTISQVKYNNNGSFVASWSMTGKHGETSSVVDPQGRVYILFKGEKEMGVEIFQEE